MVLNNLLNCKAITKRIGVKLEILKMLYRLYVNTKF